MFFTYIKVKNSHFCKMLMLEKSRSSLNKELNRVINSMFF